MEDGGQQGRERRAEGRVRVASPEMGRRSVEQTQRTGSVLGSDGTRTVFDEWRERGVRSRGKGGRSVGKGDGAQRRNSNEPEAERPVFGGGRSVGTRQRATEEQGGVTASVPAEGPRKGTSMSPLVALLPL